MKVRVLRDRFRGLLELLDHAVGSTTLREVAKQYGRKTKAWDMDHDSLITVDCPFSQLKVWLGKRPVVEPRYLMYLMVMVD